MPEYDFHSVGLRTTQRKQHLRHPPKQFVRGIRGPLRRNTTPFPSLALTAASSSDPLLKRGPQLRISTSATSTLARALVSLRKDVRTAAGDFGDAPPAMTNALRHVNEVRR